MKGRRRAPGSPGPYVVGVTGGVGSGKSTFVRLLASGGGASVVDADRLGHAMLARPAVARALAAEFGADVLDAAGAVRRDVLGPRALASDASLGALNAIVHPPLLVELERVLAAHAAAPSPEERLLVLDAALLVEWDAGGLCDEVVAVVADPEVRVARIVRERGRTEEWARSVVARQLPDAARVAYADVVVANDGTLQEFLAAANAAAAAIRARAGAGRAARERSSNAGQEERWTG